MEFELSSDDLLMILTILKQRHPLPSELNTLFHKIELKNEHIGTFMIHYLCMIINKNKCVKMLPWPLVDKKNKCHFYAGLRKFLSESSKEFPSFDWPKVLSSTLSLPQSNKYATFLHKFLMCTYEIHISKNLGFYDVPLSLNNCSEKFTNIVAWKCSEKLKNKRLGESKLERIKELREKNKILDEKLALLPKIETCPETNPSTIIEESFKSVNDSLDAIEELKKNRCLELDEFNASMEFLKNLAAPEDYQSLSLIDLEPKIDKLCNISGIDTTKDSLKNRVFSSKLSNLLNILAVKKQWLIKNYHKENEEIFEISDQDELYAPICPLFEDVDITMDNGIETSINLTPSRKDISNCIQEAKKKLFEELETFKPDNIIAEVKHNLSQSMLFKNANRTMGTSASPLARSVMEKQTWSQAVTPSASRERRSLIKPLKASSPLSDSLSSFSSFEESMDCIFTDNSLINEQSNTSDFLPVHRDSIDSIVENSSPRNSLESVINRYRELRRKMK